jgi:hypothetical protein
MDHIYEGPTVKIPSAGDYRVAAAGNLRRGEIAAVFVDALPRICKILNSRDGPFVARISRFATVVIA